MSKEELVQTIKKIVSLTRSGAWDEAYEGYRELFSSPTFSSRRQEDQRQALRLMIHAKGAPEKPTKAMVEAHKCAIEPLKAIVAALNDPADYEMLGMCLVLAGDSAAAAESFRTGLTLERQRNAGSDLCGELMKRLSLT